MIRKLVLVLMLFFGSICQAENLGDFPEDSTVHFQFCTNNKNGAAVAPLTEFEANDIRVYKNNSATEKTTTNGIMMTSPFDSVVGLHAVDIDTNNNTGDAGFWTTGADYIVVLNPDTETIDSEIVVDVSAQFSIQNRYMRGTDNAALASVCTETRLAELDPNNLPADANTGAGLNNGNNQVTLSSDGLKNISIAEPNNDPNSWDFRDWLFWLPKIRFGGKTTCDDDWQKSYNNVGTAITKQSVSDIDDIQTIGKAQTP